MNASLPGTRMNDGSCRGHALSARAFNAGTWRRGRRLLPDQRPAAVSSRLEANDERLAGAWLLTARDEGEPGGIASVAHVTRDAG